MLSWSSLVVRGLQRLPGPSLASSASNLLLSAVKVEVVQSQFYGRDNRMKYIILKDPPVGPQKKLAPYVRLNGRVGPPGNYRRIVHYPKDGKYTIKPLPITKLGGRDPVTGRKVIEGWGGGSKQRYRWIDWFRLPLDWDPDGPDLVEKVVEVRYDPIRPAKIALVGQGTRLRWLIATENMKVGDLIHTSGRIPSIPVKPVLGNSYPLGALPVGTEICLVQWLPREERNEVCQATESTTILRKDSDRVIIKNTDGKELSLDQRCQCVVGKVSIHPLKAAPIGSPNRLRWMGRRPRSGLWQRKTGRFGRKNKPPPPVEVVKPEKPDKVKYDFLTHHLHGAKGKPRGSKRRAAKEYIEKKVKELNDETTPKIWTKRDW